MYPVKSFLLNVDQLKNVVGKFADHSAGNCKNDLDLDSETTP
ncbi:hypothetical protein [Peribacillus cavernae]|nr:hypothetical protein [Peribacillus cavernae]MDQ0218902.1 hypothetical protein [Peribacillus cavernae]